MSDITNKVNQHKKSLGSFSFALGAILIGVFLILASMLPLGGLAPTSQWTGKDAENFATISEEYHRSASQSPGGAGLTAEQIDIQNGKLKDSFEEMSKKLEHAKSQPQRWSRILLGIGSLLTAVGFYANATRRS